MKCEFEFHLWGISYYFKRSLIDTFKDFANLEIVESVGFVLPFSILLTYPRPNPSLREISPCVIPLAVLISFKFFPSFFDSLVTRIVYLLLHSATMLQYNTVPNEMHFGKRNAFLI